MNGNISCKCEIYFTTVRCSLVFDLRRGMTNLLKMGWGGKKEYNGGGVVFLFIMLSVNNRKRGIRIDENMGSGCIL